MRILVPIDGSDCSFRALEFAIDLAARYDGTLHIVHITDYEGEASDAVIDRARSELETAGVADDPEIVTDLQLSDPRYANRVGKDILELVTERGYDHVVMGHHGTGAVGRLVIGSAAETVVRAAETPVTIIP